MSINPCTCAQQLFDLYNNSCNNSLQQLKNSIALIENRLFDPFSYADSNGQNIFHIAAKKLDYLFIQTLLINTDFKYKEEHLKKFTKSLVQQINKKDNSDNTPLTNAIQQSNNKTKKKSYKMVKTLLVFGANPYPTPTDREAPLHEAVKKHLPDHVALLCENAKKMLSPDNYRSFIDSKIGYVYWENVGYTPLYLGASNESIKSIEYLLKEGADIRTTNGKNGNTVLHLAATRADDFDNLVQILCKHASETLHPENCAAFINAKSLSEETALYEAVREKNIEVVKVLLTWGANPCEPCTETEETVLHWAALNSYESYDFESEDDQLCFDMIKEICEFIKRREKGALKHMLDFKDANGDTALYLAIPTACMSSAEEEGRFDIPKQVIAYLIENGASLDIQCGENEETPRQKLIAHGNEDFLEEILRRDEG